MSETYCFQKFKLEFICSFSFNTRSNRESLKKDNRDYLFKSCFEKITNTRSLPEYFVPTGMITKLFFLDVFLF